MKSINGTDLREKEKWMKREIKRYKKRKRKTDKLTETNSNSKTAIHIPTKNKRATKHTNIHTDKIK